ncbi:MAG: type II toxin-antitoxin system PemK/MazF family toxin [Erysipelotrichaceae bacterium]|nr:type II toxin-antitoxin system PemK/MazF family toxin [Erysipelotrichaceae bacterium]
MMRRGDIYYADLSGSIGSEQCGIRPVLIVQNDKGNKHSHTVIAAPISTRLSKPPIPTHVMIPSSVLERSSMILLEQLRTLDKQRLGQWICTLDQKTMDKVDEALKVSLNL